MTALTAVADCAIALNGNKSAAVMRNAEYGEVRRSGAAVAQPRYEMARIVFRFGYFHRANHVYSIIEPNDESGKLFRLQLRGKLARG